MEVHILTCIGLNFKNIVTSLITQLGSVQNLMIMSKLYGQKSYLKSLLTCFVICRPIYALTYLCAKFTWNKLVWQEATFLTTLSKKDIEFQLINSQLKLLPFVITKIKHMEAKFVVTPHRIYLYTLSLWRHTAISVTRQINWNNDWYRK